MPCNTCSFPGCSTLVYKNAKYYKVMRCVKHGYVNNSENAQEVIASNIYSKTAVIYDEVTYMVSVKIRNNTEQLEVTLFDTWRRLLAEVNDMEMYLIKLREVAYGVIRNPITEVEADINENVKDESEVVESDCTDVQINSIDLQGEIKDITKYTIYDIKRHNCNVSLLTNEGWQIYTNYIVRNYEYKPYELDVTVVKDLQYTITNYEDYAKVYSNKWDKDNETGKWTCTKPEVGYGNCSVNDYNFTTKLINENDIEFKYSMKDIDLVYYDIETANRRDNRILPLHNDSDAFIGCLSMVHISEEQVTVKCFILNTYKIKASNLQSKILELAVFKNRGINPKLDIIKVISDKSIAHGFIRTLKDIKKPCVVIGFNASMNPDIPDRSIGYDLPWLLSRVIANDSLKPITRKLRFQGRAYKQISQLSLLPTTYFMDGMYVADSCLVPSDRQSMDKYTLNDYLRVFGVGQKVKEGVGTYCEIQQQLCTPGMDITNIMFYCVYDSICLWEIELAKHGLQKILYIGVVQKVPLSNCLSKTMASNTTSYISREFVKEGYAPLYMQNYVDNRKYTGAYTFANDGKALQVISNYYDGQGDVIVLDYAGMYPSAIIQCNLSPETMLTEDNPDIPHIVLSYEETQGRDQPETLTYRFMKPDYKLGIFPKILKEWVVQRNKAKAENDAIMDYCYKLLSNSFYGLLGSKCLVRSYPIAACTTYYGRKSIKAAEQWFIDHGKEILACDTDSTFVRLGDDNSMIEEVQKYIQDTMGEHMKFEFDKKYYKYMLTNAKKSYFGIAYDKKTGKVIDNVIVKGISWSLLNPECIKIVRTVLKRILDECYDPVDARPNIYNLLRQFYLDTMAELKRIVKDPIDWRSALEPYCSIIKMSGSNQLSKNLRSRYMNVKEDRIPCVELIGDGYVADKVRYLYDPEVNPSDINLSKLFNKLYSGIGKLTIKLKAITKEVCRDDSSVCSYRIEIFEGVGNIKIENDIETSVHDFIDMIDNNRKFMTNKKNKAVNNMVIHEVFTGDRPYRLFVDLDGIEGDFSTVQSILSIFNEKLNKKDIIWAISSSGSTKFHCIANVSMSIKNMEIVTSLVKKTMLTTGDKNYKAIDVAPYHNNGSMRCIYYPKINRINGTIDYKNVHIMRTSAKVSDYIISNVDDCEFLAMNCLSRDNPCDVINNEILNINIGELTRYLRVELRISIKSHRVNKTNDREYVNLDIDHSNYICPVCDRSHDKENASVTLNKDNTLTYTCFRKDTRNAITLTVPDGYKMDDTVNNDLEESEIEKILKKYKTVESTVYDINSEGDLKMEHVDDFTSKLTIIKSLLGTGKTKLCAEFVRNYNGSVLILSFRRSFTKSLIEKYGVTSYLDKEYKNGIKFCNNTRVMVQIESIHKLDFMTYPSLVVIDEVMSCMMQLNSIHVKSTSTTYDIINTVLKEAKKVIVMDGLISSSVTNLLVDITGSHNSSKIVNNTYVREQIPITVEILKNRPKIRDILCDKIVSKSANCKKVAVFASSYELTVVLTKAFQNENRRVLTLHGKDVSKVMYKGKEMTMKQLKDELFTCPESILQDFDVFIYNSTMTAGVSIELTGVDIMFGIYSRNTCSPIDFVQAMSRVRQQTQKYIYYIPGKSYSLHKISEVPHTCVNPASVTQHLDYTKQMRFNYIDLKSTCIAMYNTCVHFRDDLTFKLLTQDMRYKMDIIYADYCTVKRKVTECDLTMNDEFSLFEIKKLTDLIDMRYLPTEEEYKLKETMEKEPELSDTTLELIKPNTQSVNKLIDFITLYKLDPSNMYTRITRQDFDILIKYARARRYANTLMHRYNLNSIEDLFNSDSVIQDELKQNITYMYEAHCIAIKHGNKIDPCIDLANVGIGLSVNRLIQFMRSMPKDVTKAELTGWMREDNYWGKMAESRRLVDNINRVIAVYNYRFTSNQVQYKIDGIKHKDTIYNLEYIQVFRSPLFTIYDNSTIAISAVYSPKIIKNVRNDT